MEKLRTHEQTLNAASKPWAQAMGGSMVPADAAADKALVKSMRSAYQAQWAARQPCGGTSDPNAAALKNAAQSKVRVKMPGDGDSEFEAAIRRAESGIASCDRDEFLDGMDWLDEMADDAWSYDEEEEIDRAMDDLERKWRAAGNRKTCYGLAYPTPLEFALGADVGLFHAHSRFGNLASEITGGGGRILGLAQPDRNGTYAGLNFGARIALASMVRNMLIWGTPNAPNFANYNPLSFWDFFFYMNRATADIDDNLGTFDPGAGRDILFPGTGVGPNASGFNGGANPALNVVYRASYAWAAYRMGFGYMMPLPNSRLKVRPYGGLEYSRLRSSEELSGTIVGNDFTYQTNVRQHAIAPFVGVETAYRPKSLASLLKVPVEFGTDLRYAYKFNDASGSDFLALGAFPTAPASLSNDDNSHDIKANLNLTFNPDAAFNVGLGATWERTSVPMLNSRDGVRPSQLGREDVDNATFMFRFNWKLNPPNLGGYQAN